MERLMRWLIMGMVLAAALPAFANHDTTTPQQPGLSGPEVLYVLAATAPAAILFSRLSVIGVVVLLVIGIARTARKINSACC